MDIEIFEDLENGKKWALRHNEDNYLEEFLGFCRTCGNIYVSRYFIASPNTKNFLGSRCKTYWHSIDLKIPESQRAAYCGDDESKKWISIKQMKESPKRENHGMDKR